jgi:hypothetical protein
MGSTKNAESGWRYILMAVIAFLLLAADVLSMLVGKLLDGRSLSDPGMWSEHWYATVGTFLCSSLIWGISGALIIFWSWRRGKLDMLFSLRGGRRVVLLFCLGVVFLFAISWWESSGSGSIFPSLVREYRGFENRYTGYGVVVTAFQYLYYLFESVMVLLVMTFFQRAGEAWTRLANVPWGGFGLTLTWGLAHLFSHPEGLLTIVLTALLLGFVFVGVRKSVVPALAIILLVFIL